MATLEALQKKNTALEMTQIKNRARIQELLNENNNIQMLKDETVAKIAEYIKNMKQEKEGLKTSFNHLSEDEIEKGVMLSKDAFPDKNLLRFLQERFPNAFYGNYKNKFKPHEISIRNCKYLILKNQSIKKMDGIEFFLKLECLVCGGNDFETLDLSVNKKLDQLSCINSPSLKTIFLLERFDSSRIFLGQGFKGEISFVAHQVV